MTFQTTEDEVEKLRQEKAELLAFIEQLKNRIKKAANALGVIGDESDI